MPRHRLTDRFVRNVTPKAPNAGGRDEYLDALVPQLMLRVSPTGHKSFALLARYPGFKNPTRRLLGTYYDGDPAVLAEDDPAILDRNGAALSLAEAREKARYWLGLIARGRDPGAEKKAAVVAKKQQEADRQAAAATAFDKVAAAWGTRKLAGHAHELAIMRLIEREFTSRWRGRPIADIGRDEMKRAIRAIEERGAPTQAVQALGDLRRLLGWAAESGDFGAFVSPLKDIKPAA
jgi:hypothetical protein